jgi:probable O-glycosylation ligase (exosortase A-associated)
MILCGFSVLGSQSRGALLGGGAMLVFLWLKSRRKAIALVAMVLIVPLMIGFMPSTWTNRMHTIETYQEDASAQGRINAWLMAINLVKDHPIVGGGFDLYTADTFARWAPDPTDVHAAHSNYFQVLGEHGIPGLLLFLLLFFLAWRTATYVIRRARGESELSWAADLCRMIQVSLVGYAVGGAFLSLAYFDLPYFFISLVVFSRFYVDEHLKNRMSSPRVPAKTGALTTGRMIKPQGT